MMQKHRDSKLCTLIQCYSNQTLLGEEDTCDKLNKRESKGDKISLKRVQSKSALVNTPHSQSQPPFTLTQISTPTFVEPIPVALLTPKVTVTPISPRPKITFAWKSDLQRTKKAENKEECIQTTNAMDSELQKTKPVHKFLNSASNLNFSPHKASLISIPDEEIKLPPKVQESLIVVNYFNPTIQQRKTLQTFLERKQSQGQN